ncbi:MAG: bacteriohemerythrin [Armatimonadota bacterium]
MPVGWTPEMSVGITEIDDQHKELFKRANVLLDAIKESKSADDISRVVAFLQNYMAGHFDTEEKYMMRYGCPQYISHKARHTLYAMEFSGIKHSLIHTDSDASVLLVKKRIVDWLIDHIQREDMSLGSFINSIKLKNAA